MQETTRALLLTGSYGAGHHQAAAALAAALGAAGASVTVADVADLASPTAGRASVRGYEVTLTRAPWLYWLGYQLGLRPTLAPLLRRQQGAPFRAGLAAALAAQRPDILVALCPAAVAAASGLSASDCGGHLAVVITDYRPHCLWLGPRANLYCVAAEATAAAVRSLQPNAQVAVTGIPVSTRAMPREKARRDLGLSAAGPVVLLMCGAAGWMPAAGAAAAALAELPADVTTVVLCGRDDGLARRIRAAAPRAVVPGWVPDVAPYLAAADVLVTKAGGLSLAEALAVGVPVVAWRPIPGQEADNARLLTRAGVADTARRPRDLVAAVASLLADGARLADRRRAAQVWGRPDAAATTAAALLQLVADGRPAR